MAPLLHRAAIINLVLLFCALLQKGNKSNVASCALHALIGTVFLVPLVKCIIHTVTVT